MNILFPSRIHPMILDQLMIFAEWLFCWWMQNVGFLVIIPHTFITWHSFVKDTTFISIIFNPWILFKSDVLFSFFFLMLNCLTFGQWGAFNLPLGSFPLSTFSLWHSNIFQVHVLFLPQLISGCLAWSCYWSIMTSRPFQWTEMGNMVWFIPPALSFLPHSLLPSFLPLLPSCLPLPSFLTPFLPLPLPSSILTQYHSVFFFFLFHLCTSFSQSENPLS